MKKPAGSRWNNGQNPNMPKPGSGKGHRWSSSTAGGQRRLSKKKRAAITEVARTGLTTGGTSIARGMLTVGSK
jgi:hypothetical protein